MLADLMTRFLREHGARTAIADRAGSMTYRELDEAATVWAAELPRPAPGTGRLRVGVKAQNSAAYLVCYLAVLKAGAVPFLLDRGGGPAETAAIIADCGLDLLIDEDGATPPADAVAAGSFGPLRMMRLPSHPDRPALHDETEVCRFTSGSTGRPSCIEFRGHAVHRAAMTWAEGTGLSADDRIVCYASLSNGLAFNTSLLSTFAVGAMLHLGSGLPTGSAVARLVHAARATRLIGFPALYESVVRRAPDPEAFRHLRMAVSSAAPLAPWVKQEFMARTGVPLQNYFGAAEAGPLTWASDPSADPGLGQPLPGVQLRAGTPDLPGPVEVRSESMGTRYLNAPGLLESRTTEDGFYRTGDLGFLDRGSLVLSGRTSHVINVGGRKIDATEVADMLRGADGIEDAVVLEVDDQHGSSALAAVIVGVANLDPAAPRRYLAERLAAHKVPSLVRIVAEIPRGSTGKPAMAALRRLFDVPENRP